MQSIGFWQSWFIWRDAMLVALLAAAGLAYLGVWVVLKRVVYVPLALAQVSSVGVVATYFFTSVLGVHPHNAYGCAILLDPSWLSLLVALGTAFWFARPHDDSSQATVAAYLLSGAAVLILGGFVQQDLHDLQTVLFGNAVLVETKQIIHVGAAVGAMLIVHALLYRRILFVSFDPNAAGAAGVGVFSTEVILYASFALVISVATRAIGALPAFGLMVLPAMTALRLSRGMLSAFAISIGLGVLAAAFGYYVSFRYGVPTGAAMVALAGLFYLPSLGVKQR